MTETPDASLLRRLVETMPIDEFADLLLESLSVVTPAAQRYLLDRLQARVLERADSGAASPASRAAAIPPPYAQGLVLEALDRTESFLLDSSDLAPSFPDPFLRQAQGQGRLIVLEIDSDVVYPSFQFLRVPRGDEEGARYMRDAGLALELEPRRPARPSSAASRHGGSPQTRA